MKLLKWQEIVGERRVFILVRKKYCPAYLFIITAGDPSDEKITCR